LGVILFLLLAPVVLRAQELKVTLLGTGSPPPEIERFGPATLVEAGTEQLLFDVGRGVTQRLRQINISLNDVDALFLSHLHADHTVGIPDLWLTTFLDNRSVTFHVFGPEGTNDMMLNLRRAYRADSRIETAAAGTVSHHIAEGVVYKQNGVTVTAFSVDHAAGSTRAFGYRIDYARRSVVISGDTRPSENLVKFAQGADVLIHEVIAARPAALSASERARQTVSIHTSPEDAGRIFERLKPKLAVYTHVSLVGGPAGRQILAADLIPRTRSTYDGRVEVGEDLMTIIIGDRVDVSRFTAAQ
jgi:ribonuclease Z